MGNEIAKAYVQVVPSAKGIKDTLSSEFDGAGGGAAESFSSKFASVAKKAIGAIGLGKIVKDSLNAGGDLQQSFGGLDTIYGSASDMMKQYASDAAAMGISMNDYAEQAVSFGASLKQAFGEENVAQAAEAANTAIKDMADNSAKMGTDITSIQNAYQGFAKQNYTMLDNLKLGYGGTKEEMQRLLADATKLSGVEYNIDNLGDVYAAIHVIQQDLGLTGVAADEAATTFTGSMGAMKAAATNLLAALTTGGDVESAFATLGTSFQTFFQGNLIPMIKNLIDSIPSLIGDLGGLIIQNINLTANGAAEMLDFAVGIVTQLVDGFTQSAPALLASAANLALQLAQAILTYDWIGTAENLISTIRDNLSVFAAEFLGTDSGNIVGSLVEGLLSKIPDLISTAGALLTEMVNGILQNLPQIIETGITLVVQLVQGILQSLPQIVSAAAEVIRNLLQAFRDIDWGDIGRNIITGITNGLSQLLPNLISAAKNIAQTAWQTAKSFLGINSPSKKFMEIGSYTMQGFAEGILDGENTVGSAMKNATQSALQTASNGFGINANMSISQSNLSAAASTATMNSAGSTATLISLLTRQNELIRELIAKSGTYIDGKLINDSLNRYHRATGV